MKRFGIFLTVLCVACLSGCNKDIDKGDMDGSTVSLHDGSIVINNLPAVNIVQMNKLLERSSTGKDAGETGAIAKSHTYIAPYEYNFKNTAEVSALIVEGVEVQATHVKISDDGYAFVSYNKQGGPHRGGVVVFKYVVQGDAFEDVSVNVTAITSIQMTQAQVNALDFYDGKLYIAGSSVDERLGYTDKDGYNCAFFMVMELNSDKTFKPVEPKAIVKLTSFQATSIRAVNSRVYITTGDGAEGTRGGLYIYDANSYEYINSVLDLDNARSVDVDEANIYLMQARPARITKYNLNGEGAEQVYASTDEAMQKDAKSDMIISEHGYLYASLNESGLKMISPTYYDVMASRERPGPDPENDVTNSLSMNTDPKRNNEGEYTSHEMLLVANGARGIYWYDIIWDTGGTFIKETPNNSILNGTGSANYVDSKGNIVFLADGNGGLKILYFEVVEPAITQYMTMTTAAENVFFQISGSGDMIIDWGDGTQNVYNNISSRPREYSHVYSNTAARTITISGENVIEFYSPNNALTELDVSNNKNLADLNCNDNLLTELDVSNNTELTRLFVSNNLLTSLNINNSTALITLSCYNNKLTKLDVSKNTQLISIYCDDNQLTELDVSNNTRLAILNVAANQLTALDLSKNNLSILIVAENQLTELDLTANDFLYYLNASSNLFTADALNRLFGTLHDKPSNVVIPEQKSIYISNNPGADTCDRSIAEEKGWAFGD